MRFDLIDNDWLFFEGDYKQQNMSSSFLKGGTWGGFAARDFDDTEWEEVSLPHDFVIKHVPAHEAQCWSEDDDIPEMGTIDSLRTSLGSLTGGVAWYRKKICLNGLSEDERVFIKFDGIYRDAKVYVNEFFAGSNLSGYIGFELDITDFLNEGENLIAVRCDASDSEGWWYQGGGIYRHTWLIRKKEVYPENVYAKSELLDNCALVKIEATVVNKSATAFCGNMYATVKDKDGKGFETEKTAVRVESFNENRAFVEVKIENPYLWDCESPNLYEITVFLDNGEEYSFKTGIRDVKFCKDSGFYLNGKKTKIKGVCEHQDHAGVGIALFDGLFEYKIKKLKRMGCNAIRMSHNPCSESFLEACDRLGMLVMSETRLLSSGEEDLSQLKRLVLRDRKHPCVVILSIGNEEDKIQFLPCGAKIARTMYRLVKSLWDIPVTEALLYWDGKNQRVMTDVTNARDIVKSVDVTGQNYNHVIWDKFKEEYNDKPLISTEQRSIPQTRGCYISKPDKCHVGIMDRENGFFCCEGEEVWEFVAKRDYVSGLFIWTGFDYHGEPTPFSWPAVVSQFGVLDLCGFEKDGYYYYKAMWNDEASIHILPHWNKIDGMNGKRTVWCYSNCDELELYINDEPVEKKKTEKYRHTEFECIYKPGKIQAIGYINGEKQAEETIYTSGAANALVAEVEAQYDENNRKFTIVKVYTVDKEGHLVPDADNLVKIETDCAVLGCGSGDPLSHESAVMKERRLFAGLAQFIFEGSGDVVFTSDDLNKTKITL